MTNDPYKKALYDADLISISEAAGRMGIAESTIRKYESQGVISPSRSGSGAYRVFDSYERARVASCLGYKQYGFSISEAVEVMNLDSIREVDEALARRQQEMDRQLRWAQAMSDSIAKLRQVVFECEHNLGQCRIERRPAHLYVTPDGVEDIQQDRDMRAVMREMSSLLPLSKTCCRETFSGGELLLRDAGKTLSADDAAAWGFDDRGRASILPEGLYACAYAVLDFTNRRETVEQLTQTLHDMQTYVRAHGFCPVSDEVYLESLLKIGQRDHFRSYRQMFFALKPIESD